MRAVVQGFVAVAMVAGLLAVAGARAEDKKDEKVTLKGELGCPKCVFAMDGFKKCGNAIKVKKGDKDVIYVLDDKGGAEKYHKPICTEGKKGQVTGVVSKKGDQLMIKPVKDGVKFDE